jgi:hypothetical protein
MSLAGLLLVGLPWLLLLVAKLPLLLLRSWLSVCQKRREYGCSSQALREVGVWKRWLCAREEGVGRRDGTKSPHLSPCPDYSRTHPCTRGHVQPLTPPTRNPLQPSPPCWPPLRTPPLLAAQGWWRLPAFFVILALLPVGVVLAVVVGILVGFGVGTYAGAVTAREKSFGMGFSCIK